MNDSKRIGLGKEGEEQFDLLRSALVAGEGFELFFVCSSDRNAINEIQTRLTLGQLENLTTHSFDYSQPEDLLHILEDLLDLPALEEGRYNILVNSAGAEDELLAAWTRALILLNEQRNRLIAQRPDAILLLGPPSLTLAAQNRAPDLWSVRSSVFLIPEDSERLAKRSSVTISDSPNKYPMSHELRDGAYYADLAQALEGSRRSAEEISRANLLLHAADAWSMRGDIDPAMDALKEAIDAYQEHSDEVGAHKAMRKQCILLIGRGELDVAMEILRKRVLPVFERLGDDYERAETLDLIADILGSQGELDEALRIRQEELLPVYEKQGDMGSRAIIMGKIADILESRGEFDEALRIRTEEELPVYERLGDVRRIATTKGKIADILESRGELDEALRIRTEEELPVYERLGDVRAIAVTKGLIADILVSRGELNEALRIRTEEELPVYERLGDVQAIAVTKGQIADILFSRGELDEALRIHTEEELPVYERLGEVRSIAITKDKIADILVRLGERD